MSDKITTWEGLARELLYDDIKSNRIKTRLYDETDITKRLDENMERQIRRALNDE